MRKQLKAVSSLLEKVRDFINENKDIEDIDVILNKIFPQEIEELLSIKSQLIELQEEGDTLKTLYSKFIDHSRDLRTKENTIRVMSLIGSKGLDAEHVYILGCNDGNIPGKNRSTYLTDHEYKKEQRRLLFVGVTRAKQSLTISWSRNILFSQSRGHHTDSVRTITIDGDKYSQVGLSEFLQGIDFK